MSNKLKYAIQILYVQFIIHISQIVRIEQFKYRGLTQGEVELAQQVFGNLINYDQVRIFNTPYLPWQPANIFIAPNGNLFARQPSFSPDYSRCSVALQGIFIHELTHILQYQQQTNVILKGAILQLGYYLSFKIYNPYRYQFIQGKAFEDYNIEQQGDIARDIFFKKIPNIIKK
ncbi:MULTISPECIES: hypothetical protein [unclassified Acinetobacter]|uniref:hypothetical protein n=1 Tax=unclassified Acinetobacter TaxID=196816 RepID=UPI002446FA28|nr:MULTISPECIES: hypothetical protein [unclassified Acinetobacter]MDH0033011.1 hypothetical protein [Acinetobacter sp. GD04021]MDH0888387.1 hypothetical protein [Acinetobacter sp. GD03873]MDH1084796.1 hypothetical protein [Acinetobacter sp. GD03983]MDH2191687.1 hypothetical protein [Acinetobacter sp. GD03645]MDH2205304.1 hypothetical protein [Acinetobacter sp. GD03647]